MTFSSLFFEERKNFDNAVEELMAVEARRDASTHLWYVSSDAVLTIAMSYWKKEEELRMLEDAMTSSVRIVQRAYRKHKTYWRNKREQSVLWAQYFHKMDDR